MLTSFIQKRAAGYNISEMAIVFGLSAALAVFPVVVVGALLHYALGASGTFARIACMGLWLGFVAWLWVSFVVTGRQAPHERVSTGELTAMQVVCTLGVEIQALLAAPPDRSTWLLLGRVFEWVIVGFHVIYFTLAWGMGARVPLRTYAMFALILGLLWWKHR